jgi:hypothetical protein
MNESGRGFRRRIVKYVWIERAATKRGWGKGARDNKCVPEQ